MELDPLVTISLCRDGSIQVIGSQSEPVRKWLREHYRRLKIDLTSMRLGDPTFQHFDYVDLKEKC